MPLVQLPTRIGYICTSLFAASCNPASLLTLAERLPGDAVDHTSRAHDEDGDGVPDAIDVCPPHQRTFRSPARV
jgi:hypothetical protein